MNFADLNVDLQGVARRTYENLLYRSTGANFLNEEYIGDIRNTGTPIIEVIKQIANTITRRTTSEIETAINPELITYDSVIVKLTDLKMDYGFKISPNITTTNISGLIDGQMDLRNSAIAVETDTYIYEKFDLAITGAADGSEAYTNGQVLPWDPTDPTTLILNLKAILFDRNAYENYKLGLAATQYSGLVANLVSLLKYETRVGVTGVDFGVVAMAYGVDIFQINTNVLAANVAGYFGHPIAVAGDYYFNTFAQYPGNYPGFPGYWVMEGTITFGCEVVRPEALIKLTVPTP